MTVGNDRLLEGGAKPGEAGPIAPEVFNAGGASPVLLVCEHASNVIPERYGDLGLSAEDLKSHVAWDPGADIVARAVATQLDAALVAARVSRLVYDCNRPPDAPGAMPEKSEVFEIPGNKDLTEAQKSERVENIYLPFKDGLRSVISGGGHLKVMVTVHSFTPVYFGGQRDLHIGILHDSDSRLADAMLETAEDFTSLDVRRNEPYGPEDGVTHTLIEHGLHHGLLNVMIEIRNDLLAAEQDQKIVSDLLASWIAAACEKVGVPLSGDLLGGALMGRGSSGRGSSRGGSMGTGKATSCPQ